MKKSTSLILAVYAVLAIALSSCSVSVSVPSKTVGVGRPLELLNKDAANSPSSPIPEEHSENNTPTEDAPPLDNKPIDTQQTDIPDAPATPVEPDKQEIPPSSNTNTEKPSWSFENGKYSYSFAAPDRSSLSDLSDIYGTSRNLFSDQGEDYTASWYFGKTSYDASTGNVTYVWDRADDTKRIMEENLGIYRGDETRKVCYFTFDCGYENGFTGKILDALRDKQVSGVFFVTGQYVESAPELVKRMSDDGHIIGNHTVDHPNMTQLDTPEEFIAQIEGLEKMVKDVVPSSQPILYYRPPYGAANEWTLKLAKKMGIRTVEWSFTYKDYDPADQLDYYSAIEKCKSGLHPGAVFLFHTVSETNSEILPEFIDWVRGQGYEILPICDIK